MDLNKKVSCVLESLNDRARRIVFAIAVGGKSLREIAEAEGMCHIHVRAVYLNALKKLHAALDAAPNTPASSEGQEHAMDLAHYKSAVSIHDATEIKRLITVLLTEGWPMIESCARRLAQRDFEDLRQAGMIGYAAALRTHKQELGPFEGWARRWIRSEQNKVIETRPASGSAS